MKSISLLELKILLHGEIDAAGGIRAAARSLGVSASKLCEAMKPGVEPTPAVVGAVGYRKAEARYERRK